MTDQERERLTNAAPALLRACLAAERVLARTSGDEATEALVLVHNAICAADEKEEQFRNAAFDRLSADLTAAMDLSTWHEERVIHVTATCPCPTCRELREAGKQ